MELFECGSLSKLLRKAKVSGVVLHAGLECGLIGAKYPALEMISFGPTIRGAHSPAERVDIASVETFYGLLGRTLSALAGADRAALRPND